MTRSEFVKKHGASFASMIESDTMQNALAILKEECCRPIVPSDVKDINSETSSYALGRTTGAWVVLDTLSMLHIPNDSKVEVPSYEEEK